MVRMLCSVSGTWPDTAAAARRLSSCAASIRVCTWRVNAANSGSTSSKISARPVFFTAMTAMMERMRQASAAMLMMPEVNSASTVSTSPEKRAATSPGFCPTSVLAGSLVSFRDISERRAWVIFWPKSTSRLSCAEERIPSSARLPK